jgi:putative ATP-dependent endonuclease of the OLD family
VLKKIHIENFRTFRNFDLDFREGLNILVGDNDAGKTTLLEAIHLALTCRYRGRPLLQELSPHLVNQAARQDYVAALERGESPSPPAILIDLYLEDIEEFAGLKGQNNHERADTPGLRVQASFNANYSEEYKRFLASGDKVKLVPTEYFDVRWLDFGGNGVSRRSASIKASFIDASALRLHAGADYYLQRTIDDQLDPAERVELSRVYRSLRERFSEDDSIASINEKLGETQKEVTHKRLSLSVDVSQSASWESGLVPHLDELPLQFVGGGGQSSLKILLALYRNLNNCHVVLIEEPENHQSPASLNILVEKIQERCEGRQVFLSTHSSFVLNKLGIEHLVLLGEGLPLRLSDLDPSTFEYFRKLPGYDTLRVVLARELVLVEGPSDELVYQRAYKDTHGTLPMEAGIDVISVGGLSARRFLEIAAPLGKSVKVVLDNDGETIAEVEARFKRFKKCEKIQLFVSDPAEGPTLEPQLINSIGREKLNDILSRSDGSDAELARFMKRNKTACGLQVFETSKQVEMPSYINAAVG